MSSPKDVIAGSDGNRCVKTRSSVGLDPMPSSRV